MGAICIYHGNCADGFTAAWVVRKALGEDVEFHAGVYQNPPPDVTDKDVIIVDFSYKYDVLVDLSYKAKSILVLDHHKTAAEDLARLPWAGADYAQFRTETESHCYGKNMPHIGAVFDMDRCGARIAWDFFFPQQTPPTLLLHIEDRDLWRFAMPNTREIQANVFSYPYEFPVWDMLMTADLSVLAQEGAAIERKHHKDVAELTSVVTRRMNIGGYNVPVANLPYTLVSDAAHKLAIGEPFAGCYWDTPTGRVFGLRSTDDGVDVSVIAKQYGGGGHRHASGFRVSFEAAASMEIG